MRKILTTKNRANNRGGSMRSAPWKRLVCADDAYKCGAAEKKKVDLLPVGVKQHKRGGSDICTCRRKDA